MQCYESELMRLQLMKYLGSTARGIDAEPLCLDDALADAGVWSLAEVVALAPDQRAALVGRVLERVCDTIAGAPGRAA